MKKTTTGSVCAGFSGSVWFGESGSVWLEFTISNKITFTVNLVYIKIVFMKVFLSYFLVGSLLYASCNNKPVNPDAVAVWSFAGLDDGAGLNSKLQEQGTVTFVTGKGDEKLETKGSTDDGKAVYLDGVSWLSAGQGADGELNIGGRGITLFAKVKPDSLKEYSPVLGKSGNDQSVAYKIVLRRHDGEGTFIEALIGSDDIAGAHLLKHKIPENEVLD